MEAMKLLADDKLTVELFLNKITYEEDKDSVFNAFEQYQIIDEDDIYESDSLSVASSSSSLSQCSSISSFSCSSSQQAVNRLCLKCNENVNAVMLVPCGHLAYCIGCWQLVEKSVVKCFYCSCQVTGHMIPK